MSAATLDAPPPLASVAPPVPSAADRVLAEAVYRAMRMIAAAMKVRYGITILVELVDRA